MSSTRTLLRRLKEAEDQFPSRVEEVLLRSAWPKISRKSEAEIRADWRRTREKVGMSLAEEEVFAEFFVRVEKMVRDGDLNYPHAPDPTPEEIKSASELLHSQPPHRLRSYVAGLDSIELFTSAWYMFERIDKLMNQAKAEGQMDATHWSL